MSPINQRPSMDPSQRALDEKNALDYSLSHEVDKEKKIEHDPVKESYKNFSIEKEGTSLITSLKNGFKNFADLILKPLGFKTFQESSVKKNNREMVEEVMAGSKWGERVLATDPDRKNSRDPNSGVEAPSNSSSGQESKPAELSTKTLQPPKSPAQIKPTKEELGRLRDALLKERSQRLGTNSAPVPSEEKSETLRAPLDSKIQSLVLNTKRLQGLVIELQTSTTSLETQQNNVKEPKGGFRGSEALIGAITPALPKENTKTATSSSTRASSTATSAVANNPAHSSPTTPPSVEGSEKETSKKNVRGPGIIAYDWLNNKTVPKPSDREVAVLRPPIKSSSNHQYEVSHPDWTRGSNRNGTELWERKAKAQEAEKALAELEASKDQKKAPSRQTQTAKQQSSTSPCGHYKTSNPSPVGEASFVARLATNGTGGKGGRGAGG